MLITKEFVFHSSHMLVGRLKEPLHGHSYKLQVTAEGLPDKDGIIIDFHDLENIVKKKVISKLDHKHLNNVIKQPTAENITLWIWGKLSSEKRFKLFEVKLWETPTSFITYHGEIDGSNNPF